MLKESQEDQILAHLKANTRITSWEAITRFRITRLAAIIHTLRSAGHNISTENKISDNKKRFAEYTLHAGDQIRMF